MYMYIYIYMSIYIYIFIFIYIYIYICIYTYYPSTSAYIPSSIPAEVQKRHLHREPLYCMYQCTDISEFLLGARTVKRPQSRILRTRTQARIQRPKIRASRR